ncbi:MAG: HEAT repeat domain-containing protein [Proteobacteria bacterium]|nr:HEAT repeat domain-containing protein [Pseudomonadota bacterium]
MASPLLLTDEQVQRFIAQGFLCLKTELPDGFHQRVSERFDQMIGKDESHNPGNNLLPSVPELDEVFADPVVTGALTSVVGPDYVMHPHRALHNNHPGSDEQKLHKDSYWGFRNRMRNHRLRWAMVMYVPQATPLEQGPTGVVPGSQWQTRRPDPSLMPEAPGSLEAGGFLLIHYDIWHRKMKNSSNRKRFMMKFEFMRTRNPEAPTWAYRDPAWRLNDLPSLDMSAVWKRQWHWLRNANGEASDRNAGIATQVIEGLKHPDPRVRLSAINAIAAGGAAAKAAISALAPLLEDACDPVSIDAAYALAAAGEPAIDTLRDAIARNDGEHVREREAYEVGADYLVNEERIARAACYGLVEIGKPAVPVLLDLLRLGQARARKLAAYALGEIAGTDDGVAAALCRATQDSETSVRVNAVEALGWKPGTPETVAALSQAIRDAAADVRFSAAFSLAQIGPDAAAAVPALKNALQDENRYVPGYAVEALERIATPEALRTLIPFLKTARWCPHTNPASIY